MPGRYPLAEIRIYVPRKDRTVYVFNIRNEQVDSGHSTDIEDKYKVNTLRLAIHRKGLVQKKYYFSLDPNFEIPEKRYSRNTLHVKQRADEQERERLKKQDLKMYRWV